jgi:MOSC domain-containing protein YiiM
MCHPCELMENTFGSGGYNAVLGHGGITAIVHSDGTIRVNDLVTLVGATQG